MSVYQSNRVTGGSNLNGTASNLSATQLYQKAIQFIYIDEEGHF